jgi:sec-independent protein translocase protein TatB
VFGIDSSELLIIVIVALVVIGPKDLPRVLYQIGKLVGQARGMARHFRTGLDAMIREAELEELQKQWDKENAAIMAANPIAEVAAEMKPLADEVTAVLTAPAPEVPGVDLAASAAPVALPAPAASPAAEVAAAPEDAPAPRDGARA